MTPLERFYAGLPPGHRELLPAVRKWLLDLDPGADLPLGAIADCLRQQIERIDTGGKAYG